MKILVVPDSFKGSLEAKEICDIVENSAINLIPNAQILKYPIADGGEGTVAAILNSLQGKEVHTKVMSPDFREITATYGVFDETKAIMEMAQASGITLVENRDIMKMNTFGTGEMILDAVKKGIKTIYIGIGGSATNDCGLGFANALGVKFLDKNKHEVVPVPENFMQICDFDMSSINPKIKDVEIIIMSDVKNPLIGENGATYIFSRQKGSTDENIHHLEKSIKHICELINKKLNIDLSNTQGAGAAGGLGAALLAFTDAKMQSGVSSVIDILGIKSKLDEVDFVITGEGRMDNQSAFGKVAYGIGTLCKEKNIPCYAIVGSLGSDYHEMYNHGITSIITCVDSVMDLDHALFNAKDLCEKASERLLRFVVPVI